MLRHVATFAPFVGGPELRERPRLGQRESASTAGTNGPAAWAGGLLAVPLSGTMSSDGRAHGYAQRVRHRPHASRRGAEPNADRAVATSHAGPGIRGKAPSGTWQATS